MGRGQQTQTDQMTAKANNQAAANSAEALKQQKAATGEFTGRVNKIFEGNPWLDPNRLATVRNAYSTTTDATENASEGYLRDYAKRTGTNSAAIMPAVEEMRRAKMRDFSEMMAGDKAAAYDKYEDLKKFAVGALGEVPGIYSSNYATSSGLQGSSMGAQSAVDKARIDKPSIWQSVIGGIAQAGSAAITKYCWIAEMLWGVDDPRTRLVRNWLRNTYSRTRMGAVVVTLYATFGEQIAATARHFYPLRAGLERLFNRALWYAEMEVIGG